jgi:stage V sporulation protein D (sporulation-specific penicillin-binding protein)
MAKDIASRMLQRTALVLIVLIIGGFGVSLFRLIQLQLIQGEKLQQMAMDQQLKDLTISAQRGIIYDRNMKPLAQSAVVSTVVLDPLAIKSEDYKNLIAIGLSEILGIEREELLKKMSVNSHYTIVKRKIENDEKDRLIKFKKEHKIGEEIRFTEDFKRYYPYGHLASSVLGFVGQDNQGLAGLENYYDRELTGEPGRVVTVKNAVGTDMQFMQDQKMPAKNGDSLVLTIDEHIQHIMEKCLTDGVTVNKAVRGTAIMMDVSTGEVLGLASTNGYDPNNPFDIVNAEEKAKIESMPKGEERSKAANEVLQKQWQNSAVNTSYIPGSVFKIITASMGFEESVVREESPFFCSGSFVPYKGVSPIRCHRRSGHGRQSFGEAFCHSCNPAFMALGQRIGCLNFYKYFQNFGFTQKTGIDISGEETGIFFNRDGSMGPTDLAVASFGQNFRVTPIQMLTAGAAVVNGGHLLRPYLVKQKLDASNNIIETNEAKLKRQVISEETSMHLRKFLKMNAESGLAVSGAVPGYQIGGKSGTSEKVGQSRTGELDYIGSFFGFAPANSPKVALLVLIDTPQAGNYYGGAVAAPVFKKIMQEALPLLSVERV